MTSIIQVQSPQDEELHIIRQKIEEAVYASNKMVT